MSKKKPSFPRLGDWSSRAELEQHQLKRVVYTLEAAKKAPFYSRRLPDLIQIHQLDELHQLPITTKEDLREGYPFSFLAVARDKICTYHESSGTSGGQPTASYFTKEDWEDIGDRFLRNGAHITSKDTILIKTPYSMLTTGHQMQVAAQMKGAMIIPADNRSSIMSYSRVIRLLKDLEVTVAWCMPSEPLFWYLVAKDQGYDPATDFPSLRSFIVAGEPLSPAKKKRMEELWNAKIYQDYGSTETGSMAGECPFGNVHLWADRFLFEVLDPDTVVASLEGRGQLVVTSLYRQAMPLVRYNIADLVEVRYEPCSCGWNLPTVQVLGRASHQPKVQGHTFSVLELEECIYQLPSELGVLFWRASYDSNNLTVQVEIQPSYAAEVKNRLMDLIQKRLQVRPILDLVPEGTILPRDVLKAEQRFSKPRFLFQKGEDWSSSLVY